MKDGQQTFENIGPNGYIMINPPEGEEKLGTRIYLTIDNGEPFEIHTSCSQDISVNMVFGEYKVVAGASLKGGVFCEIPEPTNEDDEPVNGDIAEDKSDKDDNKEESEKGDDEGDSDNKKDAPVADR